MNQKQQPTASSPKPDKPRTLEELEKALGKDMGYAILQTLTAHKIFHQVVVPVLEKNGLLNESLIINNASLEAHLLFLRKLNEFFTPLCKGRVKEDDLRAEHYKGFESPGPFLSDEYEGELHKRVGHITLMSVRYGEKNWEELIERSLPIAVDRLLKFCTFLRESYQPLSSSARGDVQFYIESLEQFAKIWPMTAGPDADSSSLGSPR